MLRPYLKQRCRGSADFSLRLAWLLGAYGAVDGNGKRSRGARLRAQLLEPPKTPPTPRPVLHHHRSRSDASALRAPPLPPVPAPPLALGDLLSGRAFDCGCPSPSNCQCLQPQLHFIGKYRVVLKLFIYAPLYNGLMRVRVCSLYKYRFSECFFYLLRK